MVARADARRVRGFLLRGRPPIGHATIPANATPRQVRRPCMCRSIKTLHNFRPPATEEEVRASSLQFVRKLSGFSKPSKANEAPFAQAVDQVTQAAHELLAS